MSRKAIQVALEALESDPISHAGLVTVLSTGKGTGLNYARASQKTAVSPDGSTGFIDGVWHGLEPKKKEWVGLTDGEIDILSCETVKGNKSVNWLCKVLEAKLKEKNQ